MNCHGGQMAADTTRLQGEIIDNPENQPLEVEKLLLGFLRSMIEEQNLIPCEQKEAV